jgi:ElaB/YqjD/DUF883 family membrane-anchored ribosome-binding protein
MADEPDTNANDDGLRRELANLRAVLAERRDDMVAAASRGAQAVVTPVRENPGVVTSAFVLGGVIGFLIGLAVGQSDQGSRHWYDRHR